MADVTDSFYASSGFVGYGAQFLVGQGDSPETFTAVPEIESISPLVSGTTGVVDFTHLRSPDRHKEKKGTLRDSGAITISGNYRPSHGAHLLAGGDGFDSTHNLEYLWAAVVENNFRIQLPDAAGLEGSPSAGIQLPLVGTITKYEIGAITTEGKVPFVCEITPLRAYFTR